MTIDPRLRRQLAAAAHPLKACATVSADRLSDDAIEHVRRLFADRELVKVRIDAVDRQACDAAAQRLAAAIPCGLVQRVGRVATLYRAAASADNDRADAPG